LLGGLLFVFVSPPFQVPDEPAHFRRAYQIGTGAPLVRRPDGALGVEQPASLGALIQLSLAGMPYQPLQRMPAGTLAAASRIPLDPSHLAFVPLALSNLTPYGPAPYLPQAAAAAFGRWLALPPLWILYLARLCNLAACLALTWAAVRMAPFYQWFFVFLALTPMAMFLRSSASADALTNAAAMLLVSVICALAYSPPAAEPVLQEANPAPARWRIACLLAMAALVAACKGGYVLLNLLVPLIPPRRLGRPRIRAAVLAAVLVITAAGVVNSSSTAKTAFAHFQRDPGVQPYLQAQGVAAHPMRFLGIVIADYGKHLTRYAVGFVGNFGWLDTPLPVAVLVTYALFLLALAVTGGDGATAISGRDRLLIAAVVLAELLVISASQYLAWTVVGAPAIEGLQGRYFLPLAPVAALLLYNRRWAGALAAALAGGQTGRLGRMEKALAVASAAFTAVSLLRIWTRYHGW
jgi:uncharacterized membrane protein